MILSSWWARKKSKSRGYVQHKFVLDLEDPTKKERKKERRERKWQKTR